MTTPTLGNEDFDLLLEMFCCVIAADKKIGGRELNVVADALASVGYRSQGDELRARLVECCRKIHRHGVGPYVDRLCSRVQSTVRPEVAEAFTRYESQLVNADGVATLEEKELSAKLVKALNASQSIVPGVKPAASSMPQRAASIEANQSNAASPKPESTATTPPWKVAAALVCVFPYGIYLLWNHPTLGRSKWWWRFAIAFPFAVGLVGAVVSPPKPSPPKPSPSSERNERAGDEEKSYTVSKGFMNGKLKVVTGGDVGTNLRLTSFSWKGNSLDATVEWVAGDLPPWRYNYTVYDKKEDVVQTGVLGGGRNGTGRGDKLRVHMFIGNEEAKDAVELRIHLP